MYPDKIQLNNGMELKYNSAGSLCWNIFQTLDQLKDGEYTVYGFCYYCRLHGEIYVHKGNLDSAADPHRWEMVRDIRG